MATLSEHDIELIARDPLGGSLDHLMKSLQDAEQSCSSKSDPHDDANNFEQDRQDIISRLLTTLMGTKVAFRLLSKTSGRDVASDLALLFSRIRKGDFTYSYYRPLVRLVLRKASDSEIWSAVLDLITTLTRVTPPESVPATFDSTPITHSSASQQGVEQTRELVERKVFEEIRLCTYRDVEGFFEKYFEGKDWTRRALGVYEATKDRHVDGAWTDLPDPPVQAEVLDWWFRFQDDFLSGERRRYYSTTNPNDLIGAEAQRQIDLFVKRKNGQPDAAHDWRDVERKPIHPVEEVMTSTPALTAAFEDESNFIAYCCQVHSHTYTCLKYSLKGVVEQGADPQKRTACRFKAPWKIVDETGFTEEGLLQIRRNHPLVNRYNKSLAVGLRHNHDVSMILTKTKGLAMVYYITNYATKLDTPMWKRIALASEVARQLREAGGPSSRAPDPALRDDRQQAVLNESRQFLMRAANRIFSERQLSAVEVCYHRIGTQIPSMDLFPKREIGLRRLPFDKKGGK
ncbi:hypothetical protein HIM_12587 [Hirsutella minnesotensis 3608]|uniref:Uncharacterized protein n=1 Tax=Hirsutella minnesotensis 3608 TaxID=1043627 RepID=A0A0F7ZVY3_9HYPO|nr:hypothetical protein HIM_12587 [Hirsutella minnesotensis 3608]